MQYGQETPPDYNLKALKKRLSNTKLLLIRGINDFAVSEEDFSQLVEYLPADASIRNIDDYNHVDVLWAKD